MRCLNCGKNLMDNAKFCEQCGADQSTIVVNPQSAPAHQQYQAPEQQYQAPAQQQYQAPAQQQYQAPAQQYYAPVQPQQYYNGQPMPDGQYYGYAQVPGGARPIDVVSIIGFVCSLLSWVFLFVGIGVLSIMLGIATITLAAVGMSRTRLNYGGRGFAIAGLVIGIIFWAFFLFAVILAASFIGSVYRYF